MIQQQGQKDGPEEMLEHDTSIWDLTYNDSEGISNMQYILNNTLNNSYSPPVSVLCASWAIRKLGTSVSQSANLVHGRPGH